MRSKPRKHFTIYKNCFGMMRRSSHFKSMFFFERIRFGGQKDNLRIALYAHFTNFYFWIPFFSFSIDIFKLIYFQEIVNKSSTTSSQKRLTQNEVSYFPLKDIF